MRHAVGGFLRADADPPFNLQIHAFIFYATNPNSIPIGAERLSNTTTALNFTILSAVSVHYPHTFLFPTHLIEAILRLIKRLETLLPELTVQIRDPALLALHAARGDARDSLSLTPAGARMADDVLRVLRGELGFKILLAERMPYWSTCSAVIAGLADGVAECAEGNMKTCSRVSSPPGFFIQPDEIY